MEIKSIQHINHCYCLKAWERTQPSLEGPIQHHSFPLISKWKAFERQNWTSRQALTIPQSIQNSFNELLAKTVRRGTSHLVLHATDVTHTTELCTEKQFPPPLLVQIRITPVVISVLILWIQAPNLFCSMETLLVSQSSLSLVFKIHLQWKCLSDIHVWDWKC